MPNGLFYRNSLTGAFPISGLYGLVLGLLLIIEIPVFNANSVDSDQTPRSVVSDLCLHVLHAQCIPYSAFKFIIYYIRSSCLIMVELFGCSAIMTKLYSNYFIRDLMNEQNYYKHIL